MLYGLNQHRILIFGKSLKNAMSESFKFLHTIEKAVESDRSSLVD